jgi:hypothetical protein
VSVAQLSANGNVVGTVALKLQWQVEAMARASSGGGEVAGGTPRSLAAARAKVPGTLHVVLHGAEGLRACDSNGLSDPYASLTIHTPTGTQQKQKTEVCKGTLSPEWESSYQFELPTHATSLRIVLKDYDDISVGGVTLGKGIADLLGSVTLQAAHLRSFTTPRTEAYPVNHNSKRKGVLRMTTHFVPGTEEPDTAIAAAAQPEPEPELELELGGLPTTTSSETALLAAEDMAIGTARVVGGGLSAVGKQGIRSLAEALNTNAMTAGWAGDGDHHFFKRVAQQLGPEYMVVGHEAVGHSGSGDGSQVMQFTLMQMRILIMAKGNILPHTTNWQLSCQATGIGGVVANKGGIVAKFDYRDESLCFVCSHLAAHQGAKHRQQRNDMAHTVQEAARVGNKKLDVGSQADHVFWAGDLNYRIDLPEADGEERTHEEQLEQVSSLIADLQNSRKQLQQGDELQREIKEGRAFAGFTDALTQCFERGHNDSTRDASGNLIQGTWTFAPTFKTKRAVSFGYNPQRVPSFTDRILWRSAPGREQCVELVKFSPEFELCTSDHKPVYAVFRLAVPRPLSDRIDEHQKSIGGPRISQTAATKENGATTRRVAMRFISLSVDGLDEALCGGAAPNPRCQSEPPPPTYPLLPFTYPLTHSPSTRPYLQLFGTDPVRSAAVVVVCVLLSCVAVESSHHSLCAAQVRARCCWIQHRGAHHADTRTNRHRRPQLGSRRPPGCDL